MSERLFATSAVREYPQMPLICAGRSAVAVR
jgi:hypothetical protein